MERHILGFDIGGTKCAVVAGRASRDAIDILDRVQFETRTELGPEHALNELERFAREFVDKHGAIEAIGISCGGPLDSKRGIIMSPPNLPGWDDIHIVERFGDRLGVPAFVQNDANACALAEWKWGAGRGSNNLVFLTFGTGLGAGLILDGRLYSGTNDLAGEVGHVRLSDDGPKGYGKNGSFEGFCSGGGIADLARSIARTKWQSGEHPGWCANARMLEDLSARDVVEAARLGDASALEVLSIVSRHLGLGLAMLVDILNPEVIVIGGVFMRAHDLLWPAAEQAMRSEALPLSYRSCRVVPAQLGEAIGDYAALGVAANGRAHGWEEGA